MRRDHLRCTSELEIIRSRKFGRKVFFFFLFLFSTVSILYLLTHSLTLSLFLSPSRSNRYVLIKTFHGHENDTISCLATSPNNENVACMNDSGTINLFPISFVDTLDEEKDNLFKDLVYKGIHRKEISSMDVSTSRPIFVTCDSSDRQISIWNYLNWKCEFTQEIPLDPTCVALHPSGFIVLVATKARVKLYNIGMSKLITMADIPAIKHCKIAKFSNGGQYFACSSGITNIVIYSTFRKQHLHTLVGHIAFVRSLDWSADDSKLYSVGADGGV